MESGPGGHGRYLSWKLPNVVASPPEKEGIACQGENCPRQLQLNDRPHPKTSNGRGLLHDGQIAKAVCYINEITTGTDAHGEEDDLSYGWLEAMGQSRNDLWAAWMKMESVDEHGENYKRKEQGVN